MTSRLFISLDIPDLVLDKLILLKDTIYTGPNNLRWEKKNKLHITLKFLGDVGENILELLIRRLEEIEFDKISCKFGKFNFFKRDGILKILFASINENEQIDKIHKLIEDECTMVGFNRKNRNFKPHVTLLRLRGYEELSKLSKFSNYKIDDIEFNINSFSIVKSELKTAGSQFTTIKSFNLI